MIYPFDAAIMDRGTGAIRTGPLHSDLVRELALDVAATTGQELWRVLDEFKDKKVVAFGTVKEDRTIKWYEGLKESDRYEWYL